MLELMAKKKFSKLEKEEIESNLILFGLVLVLLLSAVTTWHISYKKSQVQTPKIYAEVSKELQEKADLNKDGKIDEKDAKLIKEAFLKSDSESLKADLNQDQKVDAKDYSLFNTIVNLKEKETNATK